MLTEIVIAGSGGQGIQFAGQVLARAAMQQGLYVTYVPAYGAERRGGASFCSVVLSDEFVFAPVFQRPDVLLALDQRGRNQYAASVNRTVGSWPTRTWRPSPGRAKRRVWSHSRPRPWPTGPAKKAP